MHLTCPQKEHALKFPTADMLYINRHSTDFIRTVWLSWQRVGFLCERFRVQDLAVAKKNKIFWTLKSFAWNGLLLEIIFYRIWKWRISNFCLIIVIPYRRPTLSSSYLIIVIPYRRHTLSSSYLIVVLPYRRPTLSSSYLIVIIPYHRHSSLTYNWEPTKMYK